MESFGAELTLIDKATGPAKAVAKELRGVDKEVEAINKATDKAVGKLAAMKADPKGFVQMLKAQKAVREEQAKMRKEASSGGGMFAWASPHGLGRIMSATLGQLTADLAEKIGGAVIEIPERLIEGIGEIGEKFIEATGAEERFRLASDSMFGTLSKDVQDYIDQVAKSGELTDDELKQMVLQLKTSGFEANELGQVLPAALDVGAMLGGGVQNIQAATDALARMRLTGEASSRSLVALGLSERGVLEQLKKDTGLSIEDLKKKMGEGTLDPKQLLHAVYSQIAAKEGGELGTVAEKMGNTIDAKLKKLKNIPDQFFQGLVSSKGFNSFSDFLGKLVGELSPDSPFGREVAAGLEDIGDVIADEIGIKGGDAINTTKNFIREAITASKELVPVLADIANALIDIGKFAADLAPAFERTFQSVREMVAELRAFVSLSNGDTKGYAEATADAVKIRMEGQARIFRRENAKTEKALLPGEFQNEVLRYQLSSGGQLPYANPLSLFGAVNQAQTNAHDKVYGIPSQSSRVVPGGGMNVSQTTNIHPGAITISAPNGNPDEIAAAVNQSLPGAVQQAHEKLAVSSGVM